MFQIQTKRDLRLVGPEGGMGALGVCVNKTSLQTS